MAIVAEFDTENARDYNERINGRRRRRVVVGSLINLSAAVTHDKALAGAVSYVHTWSLQSADVWEFGKVKQFQV